MKSLIRNISIFSIFAIVFYSLAILVAGKAVPNYLLGNILTENKMSANDLSQKRYEEVSRSEKVDLVILGSSHAYRGYDTRIFESSGSKSLNLGSSSQTPILTEAIYRNYIDKLSPDIIILDIYPVLFTRNPEEGQLNILPLMYKNSHFIKSSFKSFDIRVFNSLIYFQVFGNRNAVKYKKSENEEYIPGGYISTKRVSTESKKYLPASLKIEEKNIEALKNIVADAERRGIQVFLFQSPLPEARYKSYTNNKEIDRIMQSIGTYYNYNDVGFLSNDCFFDDSHINQKGVDIYNKWVLDKIKLQK